MTKKHKEKTAWLMYFPATDGGNIFTTRKKALMYHSNPVKIRYREEK